MLVGVVGSSLLSKLSGSGKSTLTSTSPFSDTVIFLGVDCVSSILSIASPFFRRFHSTSASKELFCIVVSMSPSVALLGVDSREARNFSSLYSKSAFRIESTALSRFGDGLSTFRSLLSILIFALEPSEDLESVNITAELETIPLEARLCPARTIITASSGTLTDGALSDRGWPGRSKDSLGGSMLSCRFDKAWFTEFGKDADCGYGCEAPSRNRCNCLFGDFAGIGGGDPSGCDSAGPEI